MALALTALATLATLATVPPGARGAAARPAGTLRGRCEGRAAGRVRTDSDDRRWPHLYKHPHGPCTGSCLTIWPPLLLPVGKTVPKGIVGLRAVFLPNGRRQVTYRHRRLYTFVNDSGTSVTGNGVAGFLVAKVVP